MLYPKNPPYPETWVEFSYYEYPMIAKHYMVSNYGFIHNTITNNIIPLNKEYNKDHHISVTLATIDGGHYCEELHRIILFTFCPIYHKENFDVNHRDGIKYHNWLWNLEWCTKSGNVRHAIKNNLISLGEDRVNTVATNDQIRSICELISQGISTKEICKMINIPNCDMRRLVQNIKNGHCWTHISKDYDFSNMDKVTYTFNEDQIRIICKYMEDHGKSSSSQEILSLFGLDYHSMDKKQKMKYASVISDIRNKRTFVNICNEYNY